MGKKLIKNLLRTFLLSLVLTGFMFIIWYGLEPRGFEEGQAWKILLFAAAVFQNIFLLVAALPALFLINKNVCASKPLRFVLYFGGPVLATLFFLIFATKQTFDFFSFLLPGISFIVVHGWFFSRMVGRGRVVEREGDTEKTNEQII